METSNIYTISVLRNCLGNPENKKYKLTFSIQTKYKELLNRFLEKYFSFDNFLEQLMYIYTFKGELLVSPQDKNIEFLNVFNSICEGFSNKNVHLSELKTFLIVTRPFKGNLILKKSRETLLDVYNTKKQ